ncbi:MAG TPA: ABC transporter permease subunit, partial [bacterium]|nr:ABC transporter permease subunit [bacterium]
MSDQAWPKQQAALPSAVPRPRRSWDPSLLVWVAAGAILLFLVVNPLVRLVLVSFSQPRGQGFTLANYVAAYSRERYLAALGNSLVLGFGAAALGALFGLPMAWAVARTDMPGKRVVWASVLGAFVVPPYLGAVAWILLAGPNAGWLNRLLAGLLGMAHGPFNVYSMPGLVLVVACSSYPYVFVFTQTALERISTDMEDAAHILGAGAWRTTLRVTLPLAMPAILGALILVFLEAIALFGSPALIALPARFQVVTTQMWEFFEQPPRVQVAAAYAMPLLAVTVA